MIYNACNEIITKGGTQLKDKIKKFVDEHKEVIVKASTCVAAGAIFGAYFGQKFGGHRITSVWAGICEDNHNHVQIVKSNGTSEFWAGAVKKL